MTVTASEDRDLPATAEPVGHLLFRRTAFAALRWFFRACLCWRAAGKPGTAARREYRHGLLGVVHDRPAVVFDVLVQLTRLPKHIPGPQPPTRSPEPGRNPMPDAAAMEYNRSHEDAPARAAPGYHSPVASRPH